MDVICVYKFTERNIRIFENKNQIISCLQIDIFERVMIRLKGIDFVPEKKIFFFTFEMEILKFDFFFLGKWLAGKQNCCSYIFFSLENR